MALFSLQSRVAEVGESAHDARGCINLVRPPRRVCEEPPSLNRIDRGGFSRGERDARNCRSKTAGVGRDILTARGDLRTAGRRLRATGGDLRTVGGHLLTWEGSIRQSSGALGQFAEDVFEVAVVTGQLSSVPGRPSATIRRLPGVSGGRRDFRTAAGTHLPTVRGSIPEHETPPRVPPQSALSREASEFPSHTSRKGERLSRRVPRQRPP